MRRAFSLVELLVVMVCMTFMFALASSILMSLWSTVRESRGQAEVAAAMAQLSAQFREDVHRATAVEIKADSCELTLEDGNQAYYIVYGDRLARVEGKEKETVRRESFTLPADAKVTFQQTNIAEKPFVELHLAAEDAAAKSSRPLVTLRSCLGRGSAMSATKAEEEQR
jgi:Tfp pilus assembly protein FimT